MVQARLTLAQKERVKCAFRNAGLRLPTAGFRRGLGPGSRGLTRVELMKVRFMQALAEDIR